MNAKWGKTAASKVLDVQKHQHGFSGNKSKRRAYTKISSTMQSRKQKENTCPTEDQHGGVPDMSSQAGLVKGNEKKPKHKRTASLTDLRPEDKKKVANLIQELASLGAQKEEIETILKKERHDFEGAIKDLVNDQKALLLERQSVQSELNSCQQMLNQLQEAVLHRPASRSLLSSRHGSNDQQSSNVVSDKRGSDFDRHSALDEYINKHNSTQESMDVASEVGSAVSEDVRNPRTSSTLIGEAKKSHHKNYRDQPVSSFVSLNDTSIRTNTTGNSTINYSKKDELFLEKARLVEEQRQLRQRLLEQEELLRQTQRRLHIQEQEKVLFNQKAYPQLEQTYSQTQQIYPEYAGDQQRQGSTNSGIELMPPPRSQFSERHMNTTYIANQPSVGSRTPNKSPIIQLSAGDTGSYRPVVRSDAYSVGIQVTSVEQPDSLPTLNVSRETRDHCAQTELPVQQTKCYIGNRLVPSPSSCITRSHNSSMEETIQKTNRLLKSARKIIDESKIPSRSASSKSSTHESNTTKGSKDSSGPAICSQHSYQTYTPRKTPRELFDMTDATLASEINGESMNLEGGQGASEENDADKTELELLEDIFYVR